MIIMGETGCGKTKLIEFMSKLQIPTALKDVIKPIITVKVRSYSPVREILNILFIVFTVHYLTGFSSLGLYEQQKQDVIEELAQHVCQRIDFNHRLCGPEQAVYH